MINNKELVFSYVAKLIADGTKYHEHIKESDNIGYIDDAVDELLKTKLSEQEQELPTDIQIIRPFFYVLLLKCLKGRGGLFLYVHR